MNLINASEKKDRQADTHSLALHRKDGQVQDPEVVQKEKSWCFGINCW
jgi:hypothetical protein